MHIKQWKRSLLSLVLAVVMLTTGVMAADATGSIMRLEKATGSYAVTNSLGREISVREGGRLYSNYQVETGSGYAWISLDDTKVIKLDWNTQVTIKKSGKQLEVFVESGEIFFDVSKSLEADETLAIRTSTMYSGVRGTMGTVSVRTTSIPSDAGRYHTEKVSTLTVYEGLVATKTLSQENKVVQTEMVGAAQKASATALISDTGASQITMTVSEAPIPQVLEETPFAAVEIAESESLQARVEAANTATGDTTIKADLAEVLDKSQENLAAVESQVTTQNQVVQNTVEEAQSNLAPESTTTTKPPISSGSNNPDTSKPDDNDSDDDDSVTTTPPDPVVPTTYYTVTYHYDAGKIDFATMKVAKDGYASDTAVIPTPAGYWSYADKAFAFDTTAITADITLIWVDAPVD